MCPIRLESNGNPTSSFHKSLEENAGTCERGLCCRICSHPAGVSELLRICPESATSCNREKKIKRKKKVLFFRCLNSRGISCGHAESGNMVD